MRQYLPMICPWCGNRGDREGFDWVFNQPTHERCQACLPYRILTIQEVERARKRYDLAMKLAVKEIVKFRKEMSKRKKK